MEKFVSQNLLLIVGVVVAAVVGSNLWGYFSKKAAQAPRYAFQARLEAAQSASSGVRLVEGTVGELLGPAVQTPYLQQDVVAYAAWLAVGGGVGWRSDTEDLKVQSARFELLTTEGKLVVEGSASGVSNLVYRVHVDSPKGTQNQVEVPIVVGDHITILGEFSTRDGASGFFDDVIIVKGTYAQWHRDVLKNAPVSIPEQP
ncbi:MAG: hypothetical protein KUG77_24690 [Nannocystaceae bacterium]|nr:hypothetical protein [Nannocystaceae bacterium]